MTVFALSLAEQCSVAGSSLLALIHYVATVLDGISVMAKMAVALGSPVTARSRSYPRGQGNWIMASTNGERCRRVVESRRGAGRKKPPPDGFRGVVNR
jgi:hypothetical protein